MADYYLPVILIILAGGYALDFIIDKLDVDNASPSLPKELDGYYDQARYARSQSYLKDKVYLGFIEQAFFTSALVILILSGSFKIIDDYARSFGGGAVITGLIFLGIIYLISYLGSIPFTAYRTFVIEEKYDFNRTSPITFLGDVFKQLALGTVIGGIILSVILWFFGSVGKLAWLYSWIAVTAVELFLVFIAPITILPLFNKFTPLEPGELRDAITGYAVSQNFKLSGIYKMDASRRSSKSNAFFIGFGKYRRIVLFDTLISRMSTDELVAVLAHEVGHYKQKDIIKHIAVSIISTGLMLFMASLFINNKDICSAFKLEDASVYAGLFIFTFIYAPVGRAISVATNCMSRRYEYGADKFSVLTYRRPQAMISALKRLSADNLTNLTPHPLKVFMTYSHPPVINRIKAINAATSK